MFQFGPKPVCLIGLILLFSSTVASGSSLQLAQSNGAEAKSKLVSLWQPGDPGERMNIRGLVTSIDGQALADVSISVRQADGNGDYSERYSTTLVTDKKGRYQFATVLPGQYYGTKHIHVTVVHQGYRRLDTEILFQGDPNLDDPEASNAIFLEQGNVNNETILYGRFDISLVPE